MATEGYTTLGETTLASGYTAGSGTMALTSGSSFPAAGLTFSVRTNSAAIYSCTRSSNTLTVTLEFGSDVNLSGGATVVEVVTQRSLDAMRSDQSKIGTLAAIPSVAKSGDRYYPTDGFYEYIHNGSVWLPRYANAFMTEPVNASYAWINQGTASVSVANGGVVLSAPGQSNINLNIRKKAAPATPYSAIFGFISGVGSDSNNDECAVTWRESSSGKLVAVRVLGGNPFQVSKFDNETTFSGDYIGSSILAQFRGLIWVKLRDDGTNRIVQTSMDGFNWQLRFSVGRTDFMTADEVGFYIRNNSGLAGDMHITILHYLETA